jgi:hypothetical protein
MEVWASFQQQLKITMIIAAWLGRQDSNLRMTASKAVALPLGDAPSASQEAAL